MFIRTALLATLLAALPSTATAVAPTRSPADSPAVAPADSPADSAAQPRTAVRFTVDDCEGCEIQLSSALGTYAEADAGKVDFWHSRVKTVEDGSVTFTIPTRRTWGMSVAVTAPWEGFTGYRTTLAWRYNGTRVGETVTLDEAVTKTRAAACWEGTRQRQVTIPIVVEKVRVQGQRKRVNGSIAFAATTHSWLKPMREVRDGVLGSQDVNICH